KCRKCSTLMYSYPQCSACSQGEHGADGKVEGPPGPPGHRVSFSCFISFIEAISRLFKACMLNFMCVLVWVCVSVCVGVWLCVVTHWMWESGGKKREKGRRGGGVICENLKCVCYRHVCVSV